MKDFFKNDTKLSMGRLLSFSLFIIVTGTFVYKVITSVDLGPNTTNLIIWGWGISVGGKALQAATERLKK